MELHGFDLSLGGGFDRGRGGSGGWCGGWLSRRGVLGDLVELGNDDVEFGVDLCGVLSRSESGAG
jgi:hypothetical protein